MDKNSLWGEGRLPSLQPSLRGAHLGTTDTTLSASQPTCARVGAQPSPPLLSALILLSIFSSGPQGPADTEGSVAVGVLLDEYFMLGRAYCTAPARQLPALPGCLLEEASAGRGTSQAQALPPSKGLPVAVPSDLGGGGQTHPTFRRWRGGPCRGTWGNATEVAPWDPAPDRPQHLPAPPSTSRHLPAPPMGDFPAQVWEAFSVSRSVRTRWTDSVLKPEQARPGRKAGLCSLWFTCGRCSPRGPGRLACGRGRALDKGEAWAPSQARRRRGF